MELKAFDKKIWLSSPTMHGEEIQYVQEAYETNWMSTVGENINEVERLICGKVGCKYAVGAIGRHSRSMCEICTKHSKITARAELYFRSKDVCTFAAERRYGIK